MRRGVAALILMAFAVSALAVVLTRDDPDDDRAEVRREVTREQLIRLGVDLGPPDPDQPVVVARAHAERVAASRLESPILGSVLASCREGDDEVGYPCWVVSHDPSGHVSSGPPGAPRATAKYVVSIIDSRTGAWVSIWEGG